MRLFTILHIMGTLLVMIGGFLLLPLICSLIYGESDATSFLLTAGIAFVLGVPLWWKFRGTLKVELKDGFLLVTLGWIVISAISTLPFMIHGAIPSFTDAFFEVMSGYTTTGATILREIEPLPHGLLFWRSLTHFIGGMGIIILTLLITPLIGAENVQLYRAEGDPGEGANTEKISPRLTSSLLRLWFIYLLLNALETGFLWAGGMSLFDALSHTFGTIATGGYSTKNASLAYYNNAYFDGVVAVFMFLGGLNFLLHYHLLKRNRHSILQNTELKYYIGVTLFLCGLVSWLLWSDGYYSSFAEAIRYGAFQIISILTTTGFVTDNYEQWPQAAQMFIFITMFIGACSGSTTSGIRIIQWVIVCKFVYATIQNLLQPLRVIPIKVNEKAANSDLLHNTISYVIANIFFVLGGGCLMSLLNEMDMISALTSVMATLWNIGPGFGSVGAVENYASISDAGKWFLSFSMLAGRLDIFTVMVLFLPSFWKA